MNASRSCCNCWANSRPRWLRCQKPTTNRRKASRDLPSCPLTRPRAKNPIPSCATFPSVASAHPSRALSNRTLNLSRSWTASAIPFLISGFEESIFARLELRDGGHDFVGNFLVNLLEPRLVAPFGLGPQFLKLHRTAVFYRDLFRQRKFPMPSPGFKGAERPRGHNRRVGLGHDQPDARTRRLQVPVRRARAFRKQNDSRPGLQAFQDDSQALVPEGVTVH